jgi:hypothetical protein
MIGMGSNKNTDTYKTLAVFNRKISLRDIVINGRIILKWTIKNTLIRCVLD